MDVPEHLCPAVLDLDRQPDIQRQREADRQIHRQTDRAWAET